MPGKLTAIPHPDSQFRNVSYRLSESEHRYGPNVHILSDPFLLSHLARLCAEDTHQPVINELVTTLYSSLLETVVNREFPLKSAQIPTRMHSMHPEAVFQGPIIDPETPIVTVNLARAGTLPSHICYTALNYFMNPRQVRQDHISIGRTTDAQEKVTGSHVSGHKIGGDVDGAVVLFPDPMGATGGTLVEAVAMYKARANGTARKYVHRHARVSEESACRASGPRDLCHSPGPRPFAARCPRHGSRHRLGPRARSERQTLHRPRWRWFWGDHEQCLCLTIRF